MLTALFISSNVYTQFFDRLEVQSENFQPIFQIAFLVVLALQVIRPTNGGNRVLLSKKQGLAFCLLEYIGLDYRQNTTKNYTYTAKRLIKVLKSD